jgi:hypothetical protein
MSAIASVKLAGAVSLALIANRMDSVHKTVGDAAIGVTRTFDPEGFQLPGVARWVDRSGGIALGYPALTLQVRAPTKTSRVYRVTAKIVLPRLEQTSASTATGIQPAPTKAYDCTCIMEFLLPERSEAWERQTILDLAMSMFMATITASDAAPSDSTGSPLRAAVESFDPPY